MSNYTIAEYFTLPSEGKVYDKQVNPKIKLRSMTTADEMQRLSPSELPYQNMCDVMDNCFVENPGISSYDLCLGDYLFLLQKLRTVTYGASYKISTICPYCGTKNVIDINLDELPIMKYTDEIEKLREFDLPISKKHIRLKLQTPRILDNITEKSKEYKRKSNTDFDPTILFTVQEIIETVDGKKPNPITITDWVKNLPMADTNTILAYATRLNSAIGMDLTLNQTCKACTLDFKSQFKINAEFFRPPLDIRW